MTARESIECFTDISPLIFKTGLLKSFRIEVATSKPSIMLAQMCSVEESIARIAHCACRLGKDLVMLLGISILSNRL